MGVGQSLGDAVRGSIIWMRFPMLVSNAILVLGYTVMLLVSIKSVIFWASYWFYWLKKYSDNKRVPDTS